jgi:hypothetical protein
MKKKLISLGLLLATSLLMFGCSGGAAQSGSASADVAAGGKDSLSPQTPAALESGDTTGKSTQEKELAFPRKIIYTGDIKLVCDNLDAASAKLESRIKDFGGYISSANKSGTRGSTRESTWTIRIPAEKFDPFIKFTTTIGELQSNNRQAQDVSEEFYDATARLKNKKIEEARLVELLKHSTGKLSEILTVEKELSRVREETERIEGRLRFLSNQTDLSTITVTIQEVKNFQPEGPPTVKTQVARAFSGSIDTMKQFGLAVLLMVVAITPWLLPIGLLAWILTRRMRKAQKRNPSNDVEDPS